MRTYDSVNQMNDYLTSSDYMTSKDNKGMCFAFEVIENAEHDYTLNLYYQDHHFIGANFANGVPLQSNPVFDPAQMSPDMNGFENYSRRGYAYLHNLMAN